MFPSAWQALHTKKTAWPTVSSFCTGSLDQRCHGQIPIVGPTKRALSVGAIVWQLQTAIRSVQAFRELLEMLSRRPSI